MAKDFDPEKFEGGLFEEIGTEQKKKKTNGFFGKLKKKAKKAGRVGKRAAKAELAKRRKQLEKEKRLRAMEREAFEKAKRKERIKLARKRGKQKARGILNPQKTNVAKEIFGIDKKKTGPRRNPVTGEIINGGSMRNPLTGKIMKPKTKAKKSKKQKGMNKRSITITFNE